MFKDKIKSERKKLGLTQGQLAKKLETSRQNITNWEAGYNIPSVDLVNKLSDFFGCSTDYLLGKTECRNAEKELNKLKEDILMLLNKGYDAND